MAIHDSQPPPPVLHDSKPPPRLTAEQYATSAQVIGGYTVMKPLGDPSDGLFLARHAKLDRVVSLKALTLPDVDDAKLLQGFVTRARGAVRLEDPHLLAIHDFVEHADKWFAVTEPVFGESLRSRAHRAPLAVAAGVKVIEDAARALAVLRRARRAHGAVTSRSIFLVERERELDHVTLLDFGAGSRQDELVANSALAPERREGGEPDARADVWGLGSVLFELLEGRPFSEARVLSPLSRSREPIPPLLAELVTRALHPDPRARFSSVESMAAALPHALGLAPRPQLVPSTPERGLAAAPPVAVARPRWKLPAPVGIGILGLGLLGAVGFGLTQDPPAPPVEAPPVVAPIAVAPPIAAPPGIHPVLLQAAGNKLLAGSEGGAVGDATDEAAPPAPRLKPAAKKKPAKKKKR